MKRWTRPHPGAPNETKDMSPWWTLPRMTMEPSNVVLCHWTKQRHRLLLEKDYSTPKKPPSQASCLSLLLYLQATQPDGILNCKARDSNLENKQWHCSAHTVMLGGRENMISQCSLHYTYQFIPATNWLQNDDKWAIINSRRGCNVNIQYRITWHFTH